MLKEKYAKAEDQTGLPSGAGEGEDVRPDREHEARDREIFEDDGQLDSAAAQCASDQMEMACILAAGNFDDLSDADLAKIRNPALRGKLEGKALEAKQAAELKAHQEMWDRQMHRIGDAEYSGAQLHSMHEYLKDDKNADAFEKELMAREGITREEAKKRRMNVQEYLDIAEKRRRGQTLSAEEERRERDLQKDPSFGKDFRTLSEKVVKTEANDYGYTNSSKQTGQSVQTESSTEFTAARRAEASRLCGEVPSSGRASLEDVATKEDYPAPVIKASPLTPVFGRAESSVVPLELSLERKEAPILVASAATKPLSLQAEGATF